MGIFYNLNTDKPNLQSGLTNADIIKEACEDFRHLSMEHDVLLESAEFYNDKERLYALKESIELEFAKNLTTSFMQPEKPYTSKEQALFENIAFRYIDVMDKLGTPVYEDDGNKFNDVKVKVTGNINDAKDKAGKAAEDVKTKSAETVDKTKKSLKQKKKEIEPKAKDIAEKTKTGVSKLGKAIKSLPNAFRMLVDNTYGRLKKMNHDERKKAILEGGLYSKLSALIRMGLRIATSAALGPVLGSIFFISSIIHQSKQHTKLRHQLEMDMKQELTVTKEKIRDADSSGDNEAKYQLMRIKDQLERDIDTVSSERTDRYRATQRGDVK